MEVGGRASVARMVGRFNFWQSQKHKVKCIEQVLVQEQKYLVIFSLDAAKALQNLSLSKSERKMANLKIYNFDHVVISHPQGTGHNLMKETAEQKNSGRELFTLSAVSPIVLEN